MENRSFNAFLQCAAYHEAFTRNRCSLMPPNKSNNTVLRKSGKSGKQPASTLTREQIEDDLAAFRKAGGKIEKLGNTNTLRKIG